MLELHTFMNQRINILINFKQDEKIAQERGLRIWSNKGLVTDRGFNGCATDVKKSSTNH